MELVLNIFWLLISIAGLILWRARWTHQSRIRRNAAWREWTAFACSMVLLFFVVSLTDDLHAELMLIEECSSSRRHTPCLSCPNHSSPPLNNKAAQARMVLPSRANALSFAFISSIRPDSIRLRVQLNREQTSGRAPPAAAL